MDCHTPVIQCLMKTTAPLVNLSKYLASPSCPAALPRHLDKQFFPPQFVGCRSNIPESQKPFRCDECFIRCAIPIYGDLLIRQSHDVQWSDSREKSARPICPRDMTVTEIAVGSIVSPIFCFRCRLSPSIPSGFFAFFPFFSFQRYSREYSLGLLGDGPWCPFDPYHAEERVVCKRWTYSGERDVMFLADIRPSYEIRFVAVGINVPWPLVSVPL